MLVVCTGIDCNDNLVVVLCSVPSGIIRKLPVCTRRIRQTDSTCFTRNVPHSKDKRIHFHCTVGSYSLLFEIFVIWKMCRPRLKHNGFLPEISKHRLQSLTKRHLSYCAFPSVYYQTFRMTPFIFGRSRVCS